MSGFMLRNLRVFFKDRSAVFFSLLAVLIIIGLYVLFLGDVWLDTLEGVEGARFLMDSWIMAGLLAVSSVTTTMGAYGIMVEDRAKKTIRDFVVSPMRSRQLAGGYIAAAVLIGLIMSLLTAVLAEVYILAFGGELLSPAAMARTAGYLFLSTIANSALVLFVVSFFRSSNAFATASTIIGTLIGFLTGIYLPVGNLPEAVQWVVRCFPVSHGAVLLRQSMMEAPMAASFAGAPAEYVAEFEQMMGVTFRFGDTALPAWGSVLVLLGTALLFSLLSIVNLARKNR